MAPLQVLTLNTWGLWLVSKKRYNRILHLAEFLANDAKQEHKLVGLTKAALKLHHITTKKPALRPNHAC